MESRRYPELTIASNDPTVQRDLRIFSEQNPSVRIVLDHAGCIQVAAELSPRSPEQYHARASFVTADKRLPTDLNIGLAGPNPRVGIAFYLHWPGGRDIEERMTKDLKFIRSVFIIVEDVGV